MLDKYNIDNRTEINTIIQQEEINLNVSRSNEKSFFIELERNSREYKDLMGEYPTIKTREFKSSDYKCGVYHIDRMNELLGGFYMDVVTNVKVLAIQYSGNNRFIFELVKL